MSDAISPYTGLVREDWEAWADRLLDAVRTRAKEESVTEPNELIALLRDEVVVLLRGDGDDRSFLSAFASMFGQFQPPSAQIGVLSEGPQDVLCPLHQYHP